MSTGQVKWFNNAKGFGFILPEGGGSDLFVHYSAIRMDGYKTLKAGQAVVFDTVEGPKGLHAANIQPLEDPSSTNTDAGEEDGPRVSSTADRMSSDADDAQHSVAARSGSSENQH